MGYQGIMGYGVDFPLSRLGKAIILWVIRVYGLPEVWVKRVSTVLPRHGRHSGVLGGRKVDEKERQEATFLPRPAILHDFCS